MISMKIITLALLLMVPQESKGLRIAWIDVESPLSEVLAIIASSA